MLLREIQLFSFLPSYVKLPVQKMTHLPPSDGNSLMEGSQYTQEKKKFMQDLAFHF